MLAGISFALLEFLCSSQAVLAPKSLGGVSIVQQSVLLKLKLPFTEVHTESFNVFTCATLLKLK